MSAVCRGTASTSLFQFQTALYWAKSRRATIYGTRQAQSPPRPLADKSLHDRHNARLCRPSPKRAAQSCHGDAAVVAHTSVPRPRRDAGRRRRHRCEPARARRPIRFHEEFRAFLHAHETFAGKPLIRAYTGVTLWKHPAKLPKRDNRGHPYRLPAPFVRT